MEKINQENWFQKGWDTFDFPVHSLSVNTSFFMQSFHDLEIQGGSMQVGPINT